MSMSCSRDVKAAGTSGTLSVGRSTVDLLGIALENLKLYQTMSMIAVTQGDLASNTRRKGLFLACSDLMKEEMSVLDCYHPRQLAYVFSLALYEPSFSDRHGLTTRKLGRSFHPF